MKMLRRLRVYFTGFGIGLIAVYLIFSKSDERDLDIWTPSQRILENIRNDSVFQSSDRLHCYQQCYNLSDSMLSEIWTESKTTSLNPGGNPYQYLISLSTKTHHFEAKVEWIKGTPRKLISFSDKKNLKQCPCDE